MSGKNPRLNPLAARKRLLLGESELNRAQLAQEWRTLAGEVHALTSQARTVTALASAAGSLISGLVSWRHKRSAPSAEKPSWLQAALNGLGWFSKIKHAFRPAEPEPEPNDP
jgi:hypothetical protein